MGSPVGLPSVVMVSEPVQLEQPLSVKTCAVRSELTPTL